MELLLKRSYFKEGTHGALFIVQQKQGILQESFLCFTIELPWNDNQQKVSCIPEGCYQLIPRFSQKFQHHLLVMDVPNRSFILIHPANDALKELQGCIAPITYLTKIGKGMYSKNAMQQLVSLVYQAKERKEQILLTISPSWSPQREEN